MFPYSAVNVVFAKPYYQHVCVCVCVCVDPGVFSISGKTNDIVLVLIKQIKSNLVFVGGSLMCVFSSYW